MPPQILNKATHLTVLKRGTVANITGTAAKNSGMEAEPAYTTDEKAFYIHDGTQYNRMGGESPGNAKTGTMDTTPGSTQVVATATTDILNVFDGIFTQDGVTVNTTDNTLTIQETGRYMFGSNVNLSANVNNVTVDFELFVNGFKVANTNSVDLGSSGDPSGLYPTVPGDLISGDEVDLRISHDNGGNVTFTFLESTFYLIKQERAGGSAALGETFVNSILTFEGEILTFNGNVVSL